MKKIYLYLIALLLSTGTFAQCVIDSSHVAQPGVYPAAADLPHIQQGVLYDQTVQGRIQASKDTVFGPFTAHIAVDSVRLDSIAGLPTGINWIKNPNVLPGGGVGCVEFTGTTNDPAGQYDLTAYGMAWLHITLPPFVDSMWNYSGNLNQFSPFGGYYLVVDGQQVLGVSISTTNITCNGAANGVANANASGGSNYTYSWNTGATSASINNLSPGTYTVTVTSGGSTATATATITEPAILSTVVTHTSSSGNNGTATATTTGGTTSYTFHWNTNQSTPVITGLSAGTYTVTVTDAHGCSVTGSTQVDSVAQILQVNVTGTDVTCNGASNGTATASASGGSSSNYSYSWSNGGSSATVSNLAPGTYVVTVSDGSSTLSASVVINQPAAVTANVVSTPSGGSNGTATVTPGGGTAPYTYHWSNSQNTAAITGLAPGTYTVTVTDNHSCSATGTTTVASSVGINEIQTIHNLQLFPNPANSLLNVKLELSQATKVDFKVYDLTGKAVYYSSETVSTAYTKNIELSSLAPGAYILEVSGNGLWMRSNFVVTH